MNLAHTYPCKRMRPGFERSNDTEPLPLRILSGLHHRYARI